MKYIKTFENYNTFNKRKTRNGYHLLTIDEMNNSTHTGGDILYHGIKSGSKETALDIIYNGFKFSGDDGISLTPYSASFYDNKNSAEKFSFNDALICYKIPNNLKMLDLRKYENIQSWNNFIANVGKKPESLSNLQKFGNYDGLITICDGNEYRIYNESKLNEGIFFNYTVNNPFMMSKELQDEKGFDKKTSDKIIYKARYDYINYKFDSYDESLNNSINYFQ